MEEFKGRSVNFFYDIYQLKWTEEKTKEQKVDSLNLLIISFWQFLSFGLKLL